MATPPQSEVTDYVITTIAGFTRRDESKVKETMVLGKPPLNLDSSDLVNLSMTLRAYVFVHRVRAGTITSRDTKKDKETVGGLAKVVYDRIKEA